MLTYFVDKVLMRILCLLILTLSFYTFGNEPSALGFVTITRDNNTQVLRITDKNKVYDVLLDESQFQKKILSLKIPDSLKREAIELGKAFFSDFNIIQSDVEIDLANLWLKPLTAMASDDQSILFGPDCDFSFVSSNTKLFNHITFEVSQDFMQRFHSKFPVGKEGQQFVVVALTPDVKSSGVTSTRMIPLQSINESIESSAGKQSFLLLLSEVTDALSANPSELYITTKQQADSLLLSYFSGLESIGFYPSTATKRPTVVFELPLEKLLEDYEAGHVGRFHRLLQERYDVLSLDISRTARFDDKHRAGERELEDRPNETRLENDKPFAIPGMTGITFYSSDTVELGGLIGAGLKDESDDKALLNRVYARPGLRTQIEDLSVSIITQVDSTTFQAKAIDAKYYLTSPKEPVSISFRWQLNNSSDNEVVPFRDFRKLSSKFGMEFNIRF